MLKAILYYILFLAEYLITIFLGGFLVGLYMAMNMPSGSHSQQIGGLEESIYPFMIVIGFLGILIVWFTFGHYKFSRFSLGKVVPAAKWKAMTICTIADSGLHHGLLFHHEPLPSRLPAQADDGYELSRLPAFQYHRIVYICLYILRRHSGGTDPLRQEEMGAAAHALDHDAACQHDVGNT